MKKLVLACIVGAMIVSATSATAASLITSSQIKDGTVQNRDVRKNTISLNRLSPGLQQAILGASAQQTAASSQSPVAGPAGAAGASGRDGSDGAKGAKGDTGASGLDGAAGAAGTNGTNGSRGSDGSNGLNADGTTTQLRRVREQGDGVTYGGFNAAGAASSDATTSIVSDALRLQTGDAGNSFARATVFGSTTGVPLSQLSTLVYRFAVANSATTDIAPALKLTVYNATPCTGAGCESAASATSGFTTLVYEPTYSDGQAGIRQGTVDALGSGSKWWSTKGVAGAPTQGTRVSLQSLMAANPAARVHVTAVEGGSSSTTASAWKNFDATVDFLTLGFQNQNPTRFDFGA